MTEVIFGGSPGKRPDIVLLDIMLLGMDRLDALRYFHNKIAVPVTFLTALGNSIAASTHI